MCRNGRSAFCVTMHVLLLFIVAIKAFEYNDKDLMRIIFKVQIMDEEVPITPTWDCELFRSPQYCLDTQRNAMVMANYYNQLGTLNKLKIKGTGEASHIGNSSVVDLVLFPVRGARQALETALSNFKVDSEKQSRRISPDLTSIYNSYNNLFFERILEGFVLDYIQLGCSTSILRYFPFSEAQIKIKLLHLLVGNVTKRNENFH